MQPDEILSIHGLYDKAEEILLNYYTEEDRNTNLIADAFNILGEENTLYLLDGMNLDQIEDESND